MWDLIVSVPDHCLSFYFTRTLVARNLEVIIYKNRNEYMGFL